MARVRGGWITGAGEDVLLPDDEDAGGVRDDDASLEVSDGEDNDDGVDDDLLLLLIRWPKDPRTSRSRVSYPGFTDELLLLVTSDELSCAAAIR